MDRLIELLPELWAATFETLYVVSLAQKAIEEVVLFELRDVVFVVFGALFFSRARGRNLGVLVGWFGGEGRKRDGRAGGECNPQKPMP